LGVSDKGYLLRGVVEGKEELLYPLRGTTYNGEGGSSCFLVSYFIGRRYIYIFVSETELGFGRGCNWVGIRMGFLFIHIEW
jgi:hypothetical protein